MSLNVCSRLVLCSYHFVFNVFLPESLQEAFASSPNLVSSGLLVEISATTEPLAVDLRPTNLQVAGSCFLESMQLPCLLTSPFNLLLCFWLLVGQGFCLHWVAFWTKKSGLNCRFQTATFDSQGISYKIEAFLILPFVGISTLS